MTIAIYLGWIRHNKCGGVESFTRNLLDGFSKIENDNKYLLICSTDNAESFKLYERDDRFTVVDAGFETARLKDTILFENFRLDKLVTSYKANVCFVPCYRIPMLWKRNKYVAVIHDLQAYHFPENFNPGRRLWLQKGALRSAHSSDKIIAISEFVRKDIIEKLKCNAQKVVAIHNPILPNLDQEAFLITGREVRVDKHSYLYTISALAKNKNLITLLKLIKLIKDEQPEGVSTKLVISGIGFNQKDADNIDKKTLVEYIEQNNLKEDIIFTGFVSNERRNSLISNSQFFLFPSIFEGFGMPVVEAMELGARVITTNCTSIPEVSEHKALYVENPFNEREWLQVMKTHLSDEWKTYQFPQYDTLCVATKYLKEIEETANN